MLIAVSATSQEWSGSERVTLPMNYVRSLEGAGLVPLIVPPLESMAAATAVMQRCAGLLLTGGEDVDPARYGETPHPVTGATHARRDSTEVALFAAARASRTPVLGICRGIQLVNVALGGSLIQDVPTQHPSPVAHHQAQDAGVRTHAVSVTPGSRLAEALGTTSLEVNSYHHQAVGLVAPGLRVTATAPDTLIEGVEADDPEWWMVAVQWHPEDLINDGQRWDNGLFATFARVVQHRG